MFTRIHLFIFLAFFFTSLAQSQTERFSKKELVEDTYELIDKLDQVHPDPYINGGGKVAFHRRFQDIILSIPEEGLTLFEYYKRLLPFLARLGDAHTSVQYPFENQNKPGLPLEFRIIEDKLLVTKVYSEAQRPLLGTLLQSVEDISFEELTQRQSNIRGFENEIGNLMYLCRSLKVGNLLSILIPEWYTNKSIKASFKTADGKLITQQFTLLDSMGLGLSLPSKITLPSTGSFEIAYDFFGKDEKVAFLRVTGMEEFRESFELLKSLGMKEEDLIPLVKKIYAKQNDKDPPDDLEALISSVASATETFKTLFQKMKEKQSHTLIVDVRENGGGSSLMADILLYFLMDYEKGFGNVQGYGIRKYSKLFLDKFSSIQLDEINKIGVFKLRVSDYDFKEERDYRTGSVHEKFTEMEGYFKKIPTFWKEYQTKKYEAYYRPKKIFVLVSANTFSAGFDLAYYLLNNGAELVGTPPAQGGNCFIESPDYPLTHTGLNVRISDQYQCYFPENEEKGRLLLPDYFLTYDKWRSYNFDPNADLLITLELIANQ